MSDSNVQASVAKAISDSNAATTSDAPKKEKKEGVKRPRVAFDPSKNHLRAMEESLDYLRALIDADLRYAELRHADLGGADLGGAKWK